MRKLAYIVFSGGKVTISLRRFIHGLNLGGLLAARSACGAESVPEIADSSFLSVLPSV